MRKRPLPPLLLSRCQQQGELRSLRDKLSEKDVSLAKASRIQKELRWSLELYNRELSMIRGGSASKEKQPERRRSRSPAASIDVESVSRGGPSIETMHLSSSREAPHGNTAGTHTLEDIGATNLWYAGTARGSAESPAPIPPPRHHRPAAGRTAGRGGSAGRRIEARGASSSSSSSSPAPTRERQAAHKESGDIDTWNTLFGPENQGLAVALRSAVLPYGGVATTQTCAHTSPVVASATAQTRAAAVTLLEMHDRGAPLRGRWSPPASLSPPPPSQHMHAHSEHHFTWTDNDVGDRAGKHERVGTRTHALEREEKHQPQRDAGDAHVHTRMTRARPLRWDRCN